MGEHLIKMPDVGEGVAEAELVEWSVNVGESIGEDEVLASVMTDKATVEIPSPVDGKVVWRGGDVGEILAVGAPLVKLAVDGPGNVADDTSANDVANDDQLDAPEPAEPAAQKTGAQEPAAAEQVSAALGKLNETPLAAPAIRKRAQDAGIDLATIRGSGAEGRITHADLDAYLRTSEGAIPTSTVLTPDLTVKEIPMIGLRRKIAEKMALAKSTIPHITYVDEVDVTELERVRSTLNEKRAEGRPKITILPLLVRAMVRAIKEHPQMNARYDGDKGIVSQYGGVHVGIAAQTDNGLMVPVLRHAETHTLWSSAQEIMRLSSAARDGAIDRDELSGSTITITSLGAVGGIVTTPVINHPEVAIVGVNKIQTLPRWDGNEFRPRKIMNLSSSFDHRIIDGWDAAQFIQTIRALLETPTLIFVDE